MTVCYGIVKCFPPSFSLLSFPQLYFYEWFILLPKAYPCPCLPVSSALPEVMMRSLSRTLILDPGEIIT